MNYLIGRTVRLLLFGILLFNLPFVMSSLNTTPHAEQQSAQY